MRRFRLIARGSMCLATKALPDDGRAVSVYGDPYAGEVNRQEIPAVFAGQHTAGFDRLPVPTIKAEDPVGRRNRLPALEVGQFAAVGLAGPDIAAIGLTPQRLNLFC